MKFTRHFSLHVQHHNIASAIKWKKTDCKITRKDGSARFEMKDVEVPEDWSQNAADILADKYFRKAQVPDSVNSIPEDDIPFWLRRCEPAKGAGFGPERSAHQVFHRLAGAWTYWGWRLGYFTSEDDAKIFYDELYMMIAMQVGAPNSPQWFNTGLHWAYGIAGPNTGQWAVDIEAFKSWRGASDNSTPIIGQIDTSYIRPQPHACFIQPVADDLVNPGGIMDLVTREARIFKHGSGTGTNFSTLRGKNELLSGGGRSSGLMSFLRIFDSAAGAIQSGGTTRRAAKMVVVDMDHPEIEDFITWKTREERKARAIARGSALLNDGGEVYPEGEWEGEAIGTVSGQNSNNSVRIPDSFFTHVEQDLAWELRNRTDGSKHSVRRATDLWNLICKMAWTSGDPGLQFDDTINAWHTCKADGRIRASNPCSEYVFLDNTACNLASLNLVKFRTPDGEFDVQAFTAATRLWTVVLDISVSMASFPSQEIALGSYNYRTLGLGYANAGGLLMRSGLAYDSDAGRNYVAAITALMTGAAYETSAEMAEELGPFPRHEANRTDFINVMGCHWNGTKHIKCAGQTGALVVAADKIWERIMRYRSFRNAQTTLIAPTGTISFVMDCDTSGIEPDFALRKTKKLAGGGVMEMANESVEPALRHLGYTDSQIAAAMQHLKEFGTFENIPPINGRSFIKHAAVFHCIDQLRPMAHVEMVAAVQPFLSGAVSKTINLPNSATVEDVSEVYKKSWELGLKSVALYRDGSKTTQPLSSAKNEGLQPLLRVAEKGAASLANEMGYEYVALHADQIGKPGFTPATRGARRPLPPKRRAFVHKVKVDGHSLYLGTGEYDDGTLGEIFVNLSREGSTVRSIMECFAKAISIGIQYGVPLEEFVEAFVYTKFEPAGIVEGSPDVKLCSSIADLIFRIVGIEYLNRTDLSNTRAAFPSSAELAKLNPLRLDLRTGETCPHCGGLMIQTGTCKHCSACDYENGGCG